MTADKIPTPPQGLERRGRAFWREVHRDFDFNAGEMQLLLECCRALDEAESLRAIVATEGMTTTGSKDQIVVHPALSELRQVRLVISRLVAQLGIPAEDGTATSPSPTSLRGRKAAETRWARHNAVKAGRAAGSPRQRWGADGGDDAA